jgi:hypothetical protein
MLTPLRLRLPLVLALAAGMAPVRAHACDAHSVYVDPETTTVPERQRLSVGVGEQFTNLGTVMQDGRVVPSEGEYLNSSITQVLVNYRLTDWMAVQMNLPIIVRSYARLEEGRLTPGSVSGLGDMALLGVVYPFDEETPLGRLTVGLLGGLELPTGDSSLLGEEEHHEEPTDGHSEEGHSGHEGHVRPAAEPGSGGARTQSAIRGHDLALGSGSVDGIVGGQLYWRKGRAFAFGFLQYAIRTEGSFEFTFANDLTWSGGPGYDVLDTETWNLGLQAVVSGDTQGQDTQAGAKLDDTTRTTLYVGPGLTFDWTGGLAAQMSVDIPAVRHETALQVVPTVRVRVGLVWRF